MKKEDYKEINQRQKNFYNNKKKNFVTKLWFSLRNGILQDIRRNVGIEKELNKLHIEWIGNISDKKVLDLGCYEGNSLSLYLAKNAERYIAIDLSENGISSLQKKLENIEYADAYTMDFLSSQFSDKDFDLIYAYGVLHHFKDIDGLIKRLNEKLSPGGKIISYDPLKTSTPIKALRSLYRPFQTDRDWEWPFSKQDYFKFDSAFNILDRRAVLGKAKWSFLVNLVPISKTKKIDLSRKWHWEDWDKSKISDSHMFSCMQLTMLMQKRN